MFVLTSVLMAFDIDFRANLASKIDPKSVQNRFKSRSKPIENLILFLIPLWIDFWWIWVPTSTPWNQQNHWKTNGFLMILVFSLVTVFIALGSQLGSILGAFWVSSGVQNPSKIDFKPIPTTYQKMIAFWIALGTDFGWFLVPTWLQLGYKLVRGGYEEGIGSEDSAVGGSSMPPPCRRPPLLLIPRQNFWPHGGFM